MALPLRQIFENAVQQDSPGLDVLKERGLIRRGISDLELQDQLCREAIIETAMQHFVLREKTERLAILADLGSDSRYDMSVAADVMMQPGVNRDTTFSVLEDKARAIWSRAMGGVKEAAVGFRAEVTAAEQSLSAHDFESVRTFLRDGAEKTRGIQEQYQTSFIEAKRQLRGDFNAEFGRFWEPSVTDVYDALVDRLVFLPPAEYRDAISATTDLRQNLTREQEYATELRNRLEREPAAPSPSPGPKP